MFTWITYKLCFKINSNMSFHSTWILPNYETKLRPTNTHFFLIVCLIICVFPPFHVDPTMSKSLHNAQTKCSPLIYVSYNWSKLNSYLDWFPTRAASNVHSSCNPGLTAWQAEINSNTCEAIPTRTPSTKLITLRRVYVYICVYIFIYDACVPLSRSTPVYSK